MSKEVEFRRDVHIGFWRKHLHSLPEAYGGQESNRMTLLYFVISALDLLDALPAGEKRKDIIDWIYSQQILPPQDPDDPLWNHCGFRGSPFYGHPFSPEGVPTRQHDHTHIAMTYTALVILRVLGDDYSRINRPAILRALRHLSCEDGSIRPHPFDCESDMRYVYCATAISYLLEDWSALDLPKLLKFIKNSRSYEDVFAQGPNQEGHGGSTYCALASLHLLGQLDKLENKETMLRWLAERQSLGFQGRPNKDPDTCYTFWVGGSMEILGHFDLADFELLRGFTFQCEYKYGGFAKYPGNPPDVLHSFYGLCGLAMMGTDNIPPIHCPLAVSKRVFDTLPKTPPPSIPEES